MPETNRRARVFKSDRSYRSAEHQDYARDDSESVQTSTSLASIWQGALFKRQCISLSALTNAVHWHGCIIFNAQRCFLFLLLVLVSKEIITAFHHTLQNAPVDELWPERSQRCKIKIKHDEAELFSGQMHRWNNTADAPWWAEWVQKHTLLVVDCDRDDFWT